LEASIDASEWRLRRPRTTERMKFCRAFSCPFQLSYHVIRPDVGIVELGVGLSVENGPNREASFNIGSRLMSVTEKINERVQQLPERTQAEVLDFVEYLLAKAEQQQARREEQEWSRHSLSLAMRGMGDENGPEYTAEDLEERFPSS